MPSGHCSINVHVAPGAAQPDFLFDQTKLFGILCGLEDEARQQP
jgi:hypothetical protein